MPGGKKKKAAKPSAKSKPDPARKMKRGKPRKPSTKPPACPMSGDGTYRILVENSPVCIHEIDMGGALVSMNAAGLGMMGVQSESEITGMAYLDAVCDEDKARIEKLLIRAYKGNPSHFEFTSPGAEPRVFSSCFIPIRNSNGKIARLMGISEDITERKRAEETVIRRANQQKAVSELGLFALGDIELSELFDKTVNILAKTLDVEYCKILELLPERKVMLLRSGVGWEEGLVGHATVGTDRNSQAGYTLLSDEPVIVDDLRTETRFSGPVMFRNHKVVSGMSVLIKSGDKPYGVLGAHTVRRQSFTQDDINFLQSAANILAIAIERKKAEISLQESEKRFALAQKIASIGTWELDFSTNRFTVSDEVEPMLGIVAGEVELTYDNFFKALHYDDRQRVTNAINANMKEDEEYNAEYRILWPDKTIHWISAIGSVFRDDSGKPTRMVGTMQNITERKRAEEALKDALEFRRKIIAKSPVGIVMYDESGQCVDVNESIVNIIGATKEQMLKQNYHHIEAWKEYGLYEKAVSSIRDNSIKRHDVRIKTTFGKDVTLDCFLVPFMSAGKRQLLMMVTDISEKKKTEEALRQSEARLVQAQEIAQLGSYEIDIDTDEITWSKQMFRLFGFEADEVSPTFELVQSIVHPDDVEKWVRVNEQAIQKHQPYDHEYRIIRKNGEERAMHSKGTLLFDDAQRPLKLIGTAQDITERKKAEEKFRQAKEKAEEATKEKDKYISLIAHDLQSPFTSIVTLLELLASEKDDPAIVKHRKLIDATRDTAENAMEVIDNVLHASRFESGKIKLNPGFVDGNLEAFIVIANYGHLAQEKGIDLVNEVPHNTRLYADYLLFREVLSNLVSNAIKFCAKGDTITFYLPSGELSTIAVKDTGVGMDKDTLANIFRQGVKTISLGTAGERGTGIGLPFCAGIMEEHGGELAAESVRGGGSVFYARLPYVKPKVLIVDDEAVVRHTVGKQLEKYDVNVIEAENGEGVFRALEKNSPHLIVLDIYLPDADGLEILKRLKAETNTENIPVIIITSDDRIETREKAMRLGAVDFVSKPVKREEFIPRARKYIS